MSIGTMLLAADLVLFLLEVRVGIAMYDSYSKKHWDSLLQASIVMITLSLIGYGLSYAESVYD